MTDSSPTTIAGDGRLNCPTQACLYLGGCLGYHRMVQLKGGDVCLFCSRIDWACRTRGCCEGA